MIKDLEKEKEIVKKKYINMGKIINNWLEVVSDKEWEIIYSEVEKDVIEKMFKEKYSKLIRKSVGDDDSELILGEE